MRSAILNLPLTIVRYPLVMFRKSDIYGLADVGLKILCVALACMAAVLASPLRAQTTTTYSNTTNGTVNGSTICSAPLVRNFTVSGSFSVADVNIGILVTHTWRGDLQFTLQSPTGTRVQLTNGDTASTSGDNFNVLLDDSASQLVNSDSPTGNHSTTAPPYQNNFSPRNPLSAFNGQNSAGTWRLEICDLFPSQDNGSFRRADLYLKSPPASYADLSLTKTLIGSAPGNGAVATWRLTVNNASASPNSATGVTVMDYLPAGFTFVSASGVGTFNSATGAWTVGTVTPGQSRSIDIIGTITATAGATITNTAEIITSSIIDSDSTVNNGITTEDDFVTSSFTVAGTRSAGTAPALSCPNGTTLFDWDTRSWTAGSTNNSYLLGTLGSTSFALTNSGTWLNNAGLGGQSPNLQNVVTGGLSPAQQSLIQLVDLPSQTSVVTTTITLPRVMAGAQFKVFDVDYGVNQFADKITIRGSLRGSTVMPVVTNGVANYVIGNTAYGDSASANASGDANVTVTFASAIDTILIEYGNHSLAPANPGQQAISLHDITFCSPYTTLSVTKTSAVISNPVEGTTNAKAIPSALIEYIISVSNTGDSSVDANTVVIRDNTPADAKMCLTTYGAAGPVQFADGSPVTGLSYTFGSLAATGDSLEFSSDGGSNWNYVPSADADGCDPAITNFRIGLGGTFAATTNFTIRTRFLVE